MEPILDAIKPIRQVRLIHKTAIESRKQRMEDFPSASMNTMHLLFSGCSEEGLYLPDLSLVRKPLHRSESSIVSADKDIMIVWENWPVNEELRRKTFAVLDVKGTHPGYCRLRFNPAFSVLSSTTERQPELRAIEDGGLDKNGFIYNSKFVATMSKKLKLQKQGISVFEVIDRPGYNLRTNTLCMGQLSRAVWCALAATTSLWTTFTHSTVRSGQRLPRNGYIDTGHRGGPVRG